jgi:hypothetical protein
MMMFLVAWASVCRFILPFYSIAVYGALNARTYGVMLSIGAILVVVLIGFLILYKKFQPDLYQAPKASGGHVQK